MATTTPNHKGTAYRIPRDLLGLEAMICDPDSDECRLTAAELTTCGAAPPTGTESHAFIIAMGDLCAYPLGGAGPSHVWDPVDLRWSAV